MTLRDLTDKQLTRLYRRVLARIEDWAMGDPYGWDAPTLRLCRPGLHAALLTVVGEAQRRNHTGSTPRG